MTSRSIDTRLRLVLVVCIAVAVMALAPSVAASSPIGHITLTKSCDPNDPTVCTVNASDFAVIRPGSTITYSGPRFDPHLSSAFGLVTSGGTATGHCSLSWSTGLGICIIDGKTGTLAGFHATLAESVDFVDPNDFGTWVFTLDGAYHFQAP